MNKSNVIDLASRDARPQVLKLGVFLCMAINPE